MAVIAGTVLSVNQVSGPTPSEGQRIYEFGVNFTGTYAQASGITLDVLAALQAMKQGVTAVSVISASVLTDAYDASGTRWTLPQDKMVLSSTGNKLLTTHVYGGITDGAASGGGTEYTDATAMSLTFLVAVVCSVTGLY